MDDKTRGDIEHTIDEILDKSLAFDPDIEWVFKFSPVSSKLDFLLGFTLGRIYAQAWQIMLSKNTDSDQDFHELEEIIKRRLPDIRSEIKFGLGI